MWYSHQNLFMEGNQIIYWKKISSLISIIIIIIVIIITISQLQQQLSVVLNPVMTSIWDSESQYTPCCHRLVLCLHFACSCLGTECTDSCGVVLKLLFLGCLHQRCWCIVWWWKNSAEVRHGGMIEQSLLKQISSLRPNQGGRSLVLSNPGKVLPSALPSALPKALSNLRS